MKLNRIVLSLFALAIFQYSCTKCVKCTERTQTDDLVVEYPETCGNWRDIAKFEERVRAQSLKESKVECQQKSKIPFFSSY